MTHMAGDIKSLTSEDSDADPEPSMSDILRSNELLRYLDDHVFEKFLPFVETRSFQKSQCLNNIEDHWGIC